MRCFKGGCKACVELQAVYLLWLFFVVLICCERPHIHMYIEKLLQMKMVRKNKFHNMKFISSLKCFTASILLFDFSCSHCVFSLYTTLYLLLYLLLSLLAVLYKELHKVFSAFVCLPSVDCDRSAAIWIEVVKVLVV